MRSMTAILVALLLALTGTASADPIHDTRGLLQVGCGFDGVSSAPTVCLLGHPIGVYLDDSTPNLGHWFIIARERWPVVFVARPPVGGQGCPWPGAVCLHEWYPAHCALPSPLIAPRNVGLIIQRVFAWPGCPSPTSRQRHLIFRAAQLRRPALLFSY